MICKPQYYTLETGVGSEQVQNILQATISECFTRLSKSLTVIVLDNQIQDEDQMSRKYLLFD